MEYDLLNPDKHKSIITTSNIIIWFYCFVRAIFGCVFMVYGTQIEGSTCNSLVNYLWFGGLITLLCSLGLAAWEFFNRELKSRSKIVMILCFIFDYILTINSIFISLDQNDYCSKKDVFMISTMIYPAGMIFIYYIEIFWTK